MPVASTYPGVCCEDIPRGGRAISGVATSITAFIGRAKRGPTDKAVKVNGFADFTRLFGGLWVDSTMGFAVRDFFLNGGSEAIIVRLYNPGPRNHQNKRKLTIGALTLVATDEGKWGVALHARVDQANVSPDVAEGMGLTPSDLFDLTVRELVSGGATEHFVNLTVKESPRRIDKVLLAESRLLRWDGMLNPEAPPAITPGDDGDARALLAAEQAVADAEHALQKLLDKPNAPEDEHRRALQAASEAKQGLADTVKRLDEAASDGSDLTISDFLPTHGERDQKGLYALEQADSFNLLCIPPYKNQNADIDVGLVSIAAAYCEQRRAMFLLDPPSHWKDKTTAVAEFTAVGADCVGTRSRNAALYFPRIKQPNPLREDQMETFVPCGAVAGVFARTDAQLGVWQSTAGVRATLSGVPQLAMTLTNGDCGDLNRLGINCLRAFPNAGPMIWGARTLHGADQLADEYKYIAVRRTAMFIEKSLYHGLKWVVVESNDESLWAQIRLHVGTFMHTLFRQGAFQGATPSQAYFVKCDQETITQNDIIRGIVHTVVGFAPLRPAEFVIIKLQLLAGQVGA